MEFPYLIFVRLGELFLLKAKWQAFLINLVKKKVYKLWADNGSVSTTQLVDIVVSFCSVYSGINFFPYQTQFSRRLTRSVIDNDSAEITALFARQTGKSETVATTTGGLLLILPTLANLPMFLNDHRLIMFQRGLWVGIFAPSQRQASITYNRIRSRIQSKAAVPVLAELGLTFSVSNGTTVALTNGSFATAISASEGSNIEGESFMLIICEEAQDIGDMKIRKSIHPMGAFYNATICKIGTPSTVKGDFYNAIQRNIADYVSGKTRIRNHFQYDWRVCAKYSPKYAKYIEGEKRKLGEHSDAFRMSYCLEWPLERSMFMDIEEFEKRNCEPNMDVVTYSKNGTHVAGIDLGLSDDTVVTICEVDWTLPVIMESKLDEETGEEIMFMAYNTYVIAWGRFTGYNNYEDMYPDIVSFLGHFNVVRAVVDATRESSVAHRLKANMPYEVIPYVFTSKAKSDLYKLYDREVLSGRAMISAGEYTKNTVEYQLYIQQLGSLQKSYNGPYLVVQHPDGRGEHDDFPDSHALAVFGCSSEGQVNNTETRDRESLVEKGKSSEYYRGRNRYTAIRRAR